MDTMNDDEKPKDMMQAWREEYLARQEGQRLSITGRAKAEQSDKAEIERLKNRMDFFIVVRSNGHIENIPEQLQAYETHLQAFVDKTDLLAGQLYILRVLKSEDYIDVVLTQSVRGSIIYLDDAR
jgi:hypothetical protein